MIPTREEYAALVRRFLVDLVVSGVDIFLTEDVVDHNLVFGVGHGRDAATAIGWRDLEIDSNDVVATSEMVAVRATVRGAHQESLMDLALTGRSFEIAYAWFCRIDDGRTAEIWSLRDGLSLLQQLGAIPELPSNRSLTDPTEHQNNDTD